MGKERFTDADFDHLSREEAVDALRFLVTQFQQTRDLRGAEPRYAGVPSQPEQDPNLDQDFGTGGVIQGDGKKEFCRYRDRRGICEALTATVRVFPPQDGSFPNPGQGGQVGNVTDTTNPFNVQAGSASINLPGNIKQTCEVIGFIQQGHQGLDIEIPFNMPLGQMLRLPVVGSGISVSAKLTGRYTPKLGGPTIFSWLVDPNGSNFDRNAAFDTVPAVSTLVAEQQIPVLCQGYVGKGFSAPVPVKRIFFGWVDALAAQNTQHLCPVPRGAQTVILLCDATNANNDPAVGAAFQGVRLQFNIIRQSPGAGTTRRILNQPANTTILLPADTVAIEVVNIDVPAAGQGIPFELQYDLGM